MFDLAQPAHHWNSAGDEIVDDLPPLHEQFVIRLNITAVGEAVFIAASHADKSVVWHWCVVTKTGTQHVYHGTAAEASNGCGGARIDGVKSLAQWLGYVSRKPHVAKRAPKDAEDAIDRARAIHGEIVELVCARGLTQTSSGVKVNRARVLNAWDDALDSLEAMKILDTNAPDRTDRRPTPRESALVPKRDAS